MPLAEVPLWLQQKELIVVDSLDKVNRMVEDLLPAPFKTYDVETTGLKVVDDWIVSMQFCGHPSRAYFIPIRMQTMPNLPLHEVIYRLTPLWNGGLIGHNIGYDWKMTQKYVDFEIIADTLLSAKCVPDLWTEYRHRWDLKSMSQGIFSLETIDFNNLFENRKAAKRFDLVDPRLAVPYGCQDVILTWMLHDYLLTKLHFDPTEFIPNLECQLIKPISRMELLGIGLDTERVKAAEIEGEKVLAEDLQTINALAGYEVNINSTSAVRKLLYETCGLTPHRITAGGVPSTDAKSLLALRGQHPVIDTLNHYRNFFKLQTGFIQALPEFVQSDGCIHTSYNQYGAISGRMSSKQPNLQQIPKERDRAGDELRLAIRGSFVPPKGFVGLLDIDFSAIEYRIAASLAKEKTLMDAFNNGFDVHAATAAMMYKIPIDQVTPHQRDRGKTLNFGCIYGISEKSIAEMWNVPEDEVRRTMKAYWGAVPRLAKYLKYLIEQCRRTGYSETYFGRKRAFPNIRAAYGGLRSAAEREASNSPIQGAAADVLKIAMIRVFKALGQFNSRAVLTVHDQLVIAHHPSDNLDDVAEAVREAMEIEIPEWVPLITEAGYGRNWHDIETFTYPSRREAKAMVVVAESEAPSTEAPAILPATPVVSVPVSNQVSVSPVSQDFLWITLPGPEARSAIQALMTALISRPGETEILFRTDSGDAGSDYKVEISTQLLFELRRLGLTYEVGAITKSRLRSAAVA